LLNQDPYPAVPGDYVKLVFQVEGVDGADCSDITFNLLSDYPIEFNPEESGLRTFKRINYMKDYESNLLVPYEVRINEDALDGSTPIEIRAQSKGSAPISKTFDVEISDVRTEFEIYVKDYNYQTNEMTLEVLNIGASDIEALSLEIPKQNSIDVKGANKIVVGDLDSNEYTSADFEAVPLDGEFAINLVYSDTINTRRTIIQNITFDSSYFTNRKADEKTTPVWTYIIYGVIILIFLYLVFKRRKNKK
ncbi:MAG: hypothetical protein OEL87_01415, partial [Nanoarchaeota archaeon]|nr:hypothetical protein [Nanoarchaeota archaeon]